MWEYCSAYYDVRRRCASRRMSYLTERPENWMWDGLKFISSAARGECIQQRQRYTLSIYIHVGSRHLANVYKCADALNPEFIASNLNFDKSTSHSHLSILVRFPSHDAWWGIREYTHPLNYSFRLCSPEGIERKKFLLRSVYGHRNSVRFAAFRRIYIYHFAMPTLKEGFRFSSAFIPNNELHLMYDSYSRCKLRCRQDRKKKVNSTRITLCALFSLCAVLVSLRIDARRTRAHTLPRIFRSMHLCRIKI